jgi:hypothetical protein
MINREAIYIDIAQTTIRWQSGKPRGYRMSIEDKEKDPIVKMAASQNPYPGVAEDIRSVV